MFRVFSEAYSLTDLILRSRASARRLEGWPLVRAVSAAILRDARILRQVLRSALLRMRSTTKRLYPDALAETHNKKRLIGGLLTLSLFAAITAPQIANAQTYPTRTITMNVPFAAGGPTDTIARVIAQRMSVSLGQSIIIENVTGADGTIGVGRVARAASDGYMLSVGQWSTHVLNGAAYALPYDLLRDFEPIALLATNPLVIVTHKGVPATNLKELIDWLRTNPDRAAMGVGSMAHRVSGVYFQSLTGTRFTLVPYRGAAPAMQDMMAGQIQMMF